MVKTNNRKINFKNMKLRIVKLIHRVDELKRENGNYSIEYVVQKKSF
jgi:hypothetical protein